MHSEDCIAQILAQWTLLKVLEICEYDTTFGNFINLYKLPLTKLNDITMITKYKFALIKKDILSLCFKEQFSLCGRCAVLIENAWKVFRIGSNKLSSVHCKNLMHISNDLQWELFLRDLRSLLKQIFLFFLSQTEKKKEKKRKESAKKQIFHRSKPAFGCQPAF